MTTKIQELVASLKLRTGDFSKGVKESIQETRRFGDAWKSTAAKVGEKAKEIGGDAKALARYLRNDLRTEVNLLKASLENLGPAAKAAGQASMAAFRKVKSGAASAHQATEQLRSRIAGVGRELSSLGNKAAVGIGGLATAVGVAGFAMKKLEQESKAAFEVFLGSGEKAKRMYEEIVQLSLDEPLDLKSSLEGAKRLLALGTAADKIKPTLIAVGNAAAVSGGGEAAERIITALSQMQAKGKVSAEEMMQLAENSIPAWEILAEKIGVGIPEAMKMGEQGMIQADFAVAALVEGIQEKFGGVSRKTGQTFFKLLDKIKTQFSLAAGEIITPLMNELTRLAQKLSAFARTAEFKQWVQDAKLKMTELIAGFKEAWPSIQEAAQAVWAFLKPIGQFLKEHPKVVMAFLIYQGARLIGIVSFFKELSFLILLLTKHLAKLAIALTAKAGPALLALATKLGAAVTVAGLLKAGLIGLAVAGILFLAKKIYEANDALQEFNKQMERGNKLSTEMKGIQDKRQGKLMDKINAEQDPYKKQALIDSNLSQAKKDLTGLQASKGGQQKVIDDLKKKNAQSTLGKVAGSTFLGPLGAILGPQQGKKVIEGEQQNLADIEAKIADQKARVKLLEEAKRDNAPSMGGSASGAGGNAAMGADGKALNPLQVAAQMEQASAEVAAEEAAKKAAEDVAERIADAIGDSKREKLDRETPGFAKFREILGMEGIQQSQVEQMLAAQEGVTPGVAKGVASTFGQYGQDPRAMDALAQSLANVINQKQATAEAMEGGAPITDNYRDELKGIRDEGTLPMEQMNQFANQAMAMRDQLQNGSMSLQNFTLGMQSLSAATEQAVAAAAKKKAQEQRDALLKGDFSWQRFARLNGLMPNVTQKFNNLQQGMGKFSQQMGQAGDRFKGMAQRADPQQAAEAWGKINAFLSSKQGVITTLRGNIQLLQQQLAILDTYRQRKRVLDQIENLTRQLNEALRPSNNSPLVTGVSPLAGIFRDPGLTQAAASAPTVNVSFRSVGRPTAADARQIVSALEDELLRQGARR